MTDALEGNLESNKFINVEMIFDEEANRLDAALTFSESNPDITLQTLNDKISETGCGELDFKPNALQDILRKVQAGTPGFYEVAVRRKFTDVEFVFNEETNILKAVLATTYINPNISHSTLQDMVSAEGYESFIFDSGSLQKLAQCAKDLETGEYEIAKRPVFGEITLGFDEEARQLMATIGICYSDPSYTTESIRDDIEKSGHSALFFQPDAIDNLIEKAKRCESGTVTLGETKDAEITIDIASDQMEATITTTTAFGGEAVSEDRLHELIRSRSIKMKYCHEDILKQLCHGEIVSNLLFAEGIKPVDGEHTQFDALVSEVTELTPSIDKKTGKANFHEVNDFVIVDAGTPLMQRIPATSGVDGHSVLGEPVPATPGTDTEFDLGNEGAILNPDNQNQLLSEIRGHPLIAKTGVEVDTAIVVDNVDLKTGNIDFDGSVFVRGEVTAGFQVIATLDVTVSGVVENATIKAGRDITIGGGVIGSEVQQLKFASTPPPTDNSENDHEDEDEDETQHEEADENNDEDVENEESEEEVTAHTTQKNEGENKEVNEETSEEESDNHSNEKKSTASVVQQTDSLNVHLTAGNTISAKFMSLAHAVAGKNIEVSEYVIHSHLKAGEKILLGQQGGKGNLIGGECEAMEGVVANILGSDANVRTVVHTGKNAGLEEIYKWVSELREKQTDQVSQLAVICKKIKAIAQQKSPPAGLKEKFTKIVNTINTIRSTIDIESKVLDALNRDLEECKTIIVDVKKLVYPNVELIINSAKLKTNQQYKTGTFRRKGKNVVYSKPSTQ